MKHFVDLSRMNEFFTQDNIRSRAILGTICRHLCDLVDLLELEEVTHLTRSTVRSHWHDELVIFKHASPPSSWNDITDSTLNKLAASVNESNRRGPKITRVSVRVYVYPDSDIRKHYEPKSLNLAVWLAKLSSFIRPDHIKELQLRIDEGCMYSDEDYEKFNQLVALTLDGIIFENCT